MFRLRPPWRSASGKRDWPMYGLTPSHRKRPDSAPPPKEQVAASAPDEICKRDADRLENLRSNPTSGEVARFNKELGCEKLRPQLLALGQSSADAAPASARTQVSGGALTEAKTARGPAVRSASAAHPKWRAPAPPIRTRWAAAWHRFHARLYASGCGYEGSCWWRGRGERPSASNQAHFSNLHSNVALARLGHWFD